MTTSDESDPSLVGRLAAGDATALAQLYDRHADAVYRVAFRRLGDRQLAEEVLQDTYLTLWNRAERFDPASGSLIAWLSTIARNRAIDRHRARLRRSAFPLGLAWSGAETDPDGLERVLGAGALLGSDGDGASDDPQRVVDQAERQAEVGAALSSLPDVEREVLRLAYYEELSQTEIALRLGWPLGTVKTRTRRALFRLRGVLTDASVSEAMRPAARGFPEAAAPDRRHVARDAGSTAERPGGSSGQSVSVAGRGGHDGAS